MMRWLAEQKFLIDQGISIMSQFTSIGHTILLMAIAEDKLKKWTHIDKLWIIIIIYGMSYILGMWGIGYVLDHLGFFKHWIHSYNSRNEMLKDAAKERK